MGCKLVFQTGMMKNSDTPPVFGACSARTLTLPCNLHPTAGWRKETFFLKTSHHWILCEAQTYNKLRICSSTLNLSCTNEVSHSQLYIAQAKSCVMSFWLGSLDRPLRSLAHNKIPAQWGGSLVSPTALVLFLTIPS